MLNVAYCSASFTINVQELERGISLTGCFLLPSNFKDTLKINYGQYTGTSYWGLQLHRDHSRLAVFKGFEPGSISMKCQHAIASLIVQVHRTESPRHIIKQ